MTNVVPFPTSGSGSPLASPERTDSASPSLFTESVQSFNTSPGLFLVSQGDRPRAPHGSKGAAASHGAGPVSSPGPAPVLQDEGGPSMTELRKAVARALLAGDVERAEMFRGVIAGRVAAAQALPSSPIPDDAA